MNDDKRDRITDVVRQHIGVVLMVSLLMQGGWAGVVGTVTPHVRKELLVLADNLETEFIDAATRL
jgi:hypothetical protein